jgi:hypothetical protein
MYELNHNSIYKRIIKKKNISKLNSGFYVAKSKKNIEKMIQIKIYLSL